MIIALGEENEGCVVACPPPESNVSIKLEGMYN